MPDINHILEHANSFGSRSSVLSILAWLIGSLLASLTIGGIFKISNWLMVTFTILQVILVIAIIVAFFFCLFKGKTDILRSEKFNIQKLALEKQIKGDDLTGINNFKEDNALTISEVELVEEDL